MTYSLLFLKVKKKKKVFIAVRVTLETRASRWESNNGLHTVLKQHFKKKKKKKK